MQHFYLVSWHIILQLIDLLLCVFDDSEKFNTNRMHIKIILADFRILWPNLNYILVMMKE